MNARYDVDQVKALANGRWPEILNLPAELLDKSREHPCPKCGGNTRFRPLDDFESTGALFCNHCHSRKNGDGIAAYQWLNDCDFKTAISAIAEQVNCAPIGGSPSKAGSKSAKKKSSKSTAAKLDRFERMPWNDMLAEIYCSKKTGIVPASFAAVGGYLAKHSGCTTFALPIRNAKGQPIGNVAANVTGDKLSIYDPGTKTWGNPTSWKTVKGDQKGVIGTDNLFDSAKQSDITRVFKMEGCSDLLAVIPLLLPGEAAFCNVGGARENPAPFRWLLEILEDKFVVVIHDRDEVGVEGALGKPAEGRKGWATWAAGTASEVKNVELPYEVSGTHGKDFRDWLNEGHERSGLDKLITEAETVVYVDQQVIEDGADPHRLARVNLENYQEKHDRRLVVWKGEWYRWKAGKYIKLEMAELKSKVTAAIRLEFESQWHAEFTAYQEWVADTTKYKSENDKGPPKIKKVTPQLVTSVIAAMASQVQLPGTSVTMPCWLEDRSERYYISMQNGILDFDKVFAGADEADFLLPHSPNWFSQFQLDYEFNFASKCPTWLNYLDYVMEGDQDRIDLLQEWAGYLLTPTNYLQKFLVLEGLGGNGKTVYFAGIRAMLGRDNVSSVALENFSGQFALSTTIGKQANICGDVGEIDGVAEGQLKQFTGGDCMTFDRKGISPLEVIPTAKLMMAWNLRPRFKDRSMGVWRRMMIVPFEREVEESRRITGMDSDKFWLESGEVPAILRWAIEGLDRLKTVGKFTQPEVSKQAITEYRHESNPASEFLNECLTEEPEGLIQCQWLYELYVAWCREAGHNYPLSKIQFGKEVKKSFPSVGRNLLRSDLTKAEGDDRGRTWHHSGIDFSVDRIAGKYVYGDDIK